ncbi:expressed protein [Echinococcus multilocularis]|uniref:Expressed protein n=1 Tax=Echinococcus multilocularis TaxID=6211 RepID=A0A068YLM7_ECHMU|nr:expressed protein [Echinococcus multilocularis]
MAATPITAIRLDRLQRRRPPPNPIRRAKPERGLHPNSRALPSHPPTS